MMCAFLFHSNPGKPEKNLKTNAEWNNRRVIIFTEYRTTHQWLYEILATRGYGGERLAILHGGMDQEEREKVKAAFQTHPHDAQVRILLATDAASEGIDLQNHCNCLILQKDKIICRIFCKNKIIVFANMYSVFLGHNTPTC